MSVDNLTTREKSCVICGETFQTINSSGIYCSRRCKSRNYKASKGGQPLYVQPAKQLASRKKILGEKSSCIGCGQRIVLKNVGTGRRKLYCSAECRSATVRKQKAELEPKGFREPKRAVCRCGKEFIVPAGHRGKTAYCSPECRAKRRRIPRKHGNCERCGKPFTGMRIKRFCSSRCATDAGDKRRRAAQGPKPRKRKPLPPCERCGKPCKSRNRRFCSVSCGKQKDHRVDRRKPKVVRSCVVCGNEFESHASVCCSSACKREKARSDSRKYYRSESYKKSYKTLPEKTLVCIWCGSEFVGRSDRTFCSLRCIKKNDKSTRRARLRSQYVEQVGIGFLIKRDKGICCICSLPVDLSATVPHPLAPTIDHDIPLAKGGEHSKANCQLAHYQCNIKKNVKVIPFKLSGGGCFVNASRQ